MHEDARPADTSPFTWVCRYYRYLHAGEDRDPCIEVAAKQVMTPSGDVFAICDKHFEEDAENHHLEVVREV